MRRCGFVGTDVGGEFSWMEPVYSYFHSLGSVVIVGSIVISSPSGGIVLVEWNGFYGISLSWFWQMTNTVDAWVFRLGTGGALLFIVSYCALYFIPFGVAAAWCGRVWHDGSFLKNIRIMMFMTVLWTGLNMCAGLFSRALAGTL